MIFYCNLNFNFSYLFVLKRGAGKFVIGLNMLSSVFLLMTVYINWLYVLNNQQM
jgi:hypothetical protein